MSRPFTCAATRVATLVMLICGAAPAQSVAQIENSAVPEAAALQEVVVTAQRRGENLQSVPIAVTALSAENLQALGARTSEDLSMVAPGVNFNTGVGGGGITIRGIGGTSSGADEPGNAVYIDGVYQASPSALVFQFNDVDRIEVLKGPQGTLFGRNAMGGVVQVMTRAPTQTAGAEASIGYGNYQTTEGSLYLNAPLTSSIAANLSLFGTHQGQGWGTNLITGDPVHDGKGWGTRAKVRWEGDAGVDFTLAAMYTTNRPPATQGEPIIPGLLNRLGQPNPGFYNVSSDFDPKTTTHQSTVSATLHYDLGFAELVSISAYDHAWLSASPDLDGTPLPVLAGNLQSNVETATQELQLQSRSDSKVSWLGGLFYMNSERPDDHSIISGLSQAPVGGYFDTPTRQVLNSYSAFGQATTPLTDSTKITTGLRYTKDLRSIEAWTATANAPTPVPLPLLNDHANYSKLTWRLALEQKLSDNVLAYVSDSRGFKSGLFNGSSPTAPAVQPQTLDAYEIGIKTETTDHRYRLNASIFYYDFKDVQFKAFNPTNTAIIFLNAGRAHEPGLDLDAAATPISGLTLTAGVSLLNGKFVNDAVDKNVPCFLVPAAPTGGLISTAGGCSPVGKQLPNAPHFVGTLSATYEYPTTVGKFSISGGLNGNSGYYFEPSNFAPARQSAYQLLNVSAGWASPSGAYDLTLWSRNLLNQKLFGGVDIGGSGGNYFPQAPLTYGVRVGAHF